MCHILLDPKKDTLKIGDEAISITPYQVKWTTLYETDMSDDINSYHAVRRKIPEQEKAVQTSHIRDYTAVLEKALKEYCNKETNGYAPTVAFSEIAAHLNSAIKDSLNVS